MKDLIVHPKGEARNGALVPVSGPVAVDTFAGRIHVEWNPQAAVTPLGQLPFFTEYLKVVSGLFEPSVEECPLEFRSPNAPKKRDVLGTAVRSILSGHQRYAHISGLRGDGINPKLLVSVLRNTFFRGGRRWPMIRRGQREAWRVYHGERVEACN